MRRPRVVMVLAGAAALLCGSAGNCAAGGGYYDGSDGYQAFVASES
jgi:hypothetical protein